MLELRVYGTAEAMAAVADRLEALPGARHLSVADVGGDTPTRVTADLRPDAADAALGMLAELRVPTDEFVLLRIETMGSIAEDDDPLALVWADLLGRARSQARTRIRYIVFMAAAGVIAAFGVINLNSILIVGAMAISPDLLPITAACTGVVLRRPRLVARGLAALTIGLGVAGLTAAVVTAFLDLFDLLPSGFKLQDFSNAQTHVSASTILVALAAGVAGMLAVETRAGAAVGVAISVTTIPAAAFLGVSAGIGELRDSLSALGVLGVNVAMMLLGGSVALAIQRMAAPHGPPSDGHGAGRAS